jgi:hypothetical protein
MSKLVNTPHFVVVDQPLETPQLGKPLPKSNEERRKIRQASRAALAVHHVVPWSLRPDESLMDACVAGDPDAIAIRDSWRFQAPVTRIAPDDPCLAETWRYQAPASAETLAARRKARSEQQRPKDTESELIEADAISPTLNSAQGLFYAEVLRIARKLAGYKFWKYGNEAVEEAAQDFTFRIWERLGNDGYDYEDEIDLISVCKKELERWLAKKWNNYAGTEMKKYSDQRVNFVDIRAEMVNESDENCAISAGYISEAEITLQVLRRSKYDRGVRKRLDERISQVLPLSQDLWQLLHDRILLGEPTTDAALAKVTGKSKRTIRRGRASLKQSGGSDSK